MNFKYYFSIFLRRLPYFLLVATVVSAAAVTVAMTLPPAYVSRTQILVESPQIPVELAASTVSTPPLEQLQVMERRLLTRENLLDIARKVNVLPKLDELNPDQIVSAMRARTTIVQPRGRRPVPLLTITFEAPSARAAAGVLNEYLTIIQQEDVEFRRGRAGETMEFFEQEVEQLRAELEEQSAQILAFKRNNTDALPDSLDFRLSQQVQLQERLGQYSREIEGLEEQRGRLIQIFEQTGSLDPARQPEETLSPQEERLAQLQAQLNDALVVYSPENPRIGILKSRIAQAEASIVANDQRVLSDATPEQSVEDIEAKRRQALLDIQLAEIDSRVETLENQRRQAELQIVELSASIERTPEVTIALEDLERRYGSVQSQFDQASGRLAVARTGEVIETRGRGQRVTVIEQPAVPSQPTKPNRILIAGGGVLFGVFGGLALILLMELMNNTARRPDDLVAKFGITPFTTIPYIRTRGQTFRQRSMKLMLILVILTGAPAVVFAVHTYYLPLDLLANRVMDKIGVRW